VKRRGIFHSILVAAAVLCAVAGRVQAQQAARVAAFAQADAFLLQARPLVAAGSIERALPLLLAAIDLAPDYSEALYVRAHAEMSDRTATRRAMADLRKALQERSWTSTDPSAAQQDLADLSIRTGDYAEARRLTDLLVAAHPEDSRNLLLRVRLAQASGDAGEEARTLADAAARFPIVDDFCLLSASLLQRQGRDTAARAVIATGLQLHPSSLPLLLAAARLEPSARARTGAVDRYVQAGGSDPLSAVLGLESAPAAGRAKYLELFLRQGGLSRQDLVDRAAAAVRGSKQQSASLQSEMARFSGTRDLDANGDGFWEDRWVFENGALTRWTREPTQDGVARYSALFAAGRPVTLSYATEQGVNVNLAYSRYPFVESARVAPGVTLSLSPYVLQCPFLRAPSAAMLNGTVPPIAPAIRLPTLEDLRKAAFAEDDVSSDGTRVVRHIDLRGGTPVYMQEDASGDGVPDHRVWYRNGVAVRGSRSLAGDGVYQVSETWRDGRLVLQEVDSDGDGRIDFRESFGGRPVRSWDYNEDGIDDSREFSGAAGTTIQEFSTSLNGVFDLSIVWQGARIARLTRAGERLAVTPDPARGVTWIGRPAPAETRLDLSQLDGVQSAGGRQYLLFRHQAIIYAEVLK
jgi:tetratricopeptide (TPR) repeat protein